MKVTLGVGIFVTRRGMVLTSKRLSPGCFYDYWQNPGGGIHPSEVEFPVWAAKRELREETGLDLPETRFTPLGVDPRTDPYRYDSHGFHVELNDDEEPSNPEPDKATPWIWVTAAAFRQLKIIPGTTKFLDLIGL